MQRQEARLKVATMRVAGLRRGQAGFLDGARRSAFELFEVPAA